MDSSRQIIVIGGCNADISGIPFSDFIPEDSNPGVVSVSAGGVGRNIAENIARLRLPVKLLSAVGSDSMGSYIIEQCKTAGIDTSEVIVSDGMPTSTYLCIMRKDRDLAAAVSDMSITELLNPELVERRRGLIAGAGMVVIDNNISPETIAAVKQAGPCRILFDAVSGKKLRRSMEEIRDIDTVKLNALEAEILSGMEIPSPNFAAVAARRIRNRNISHVFITLGAAGAFYLAPDGTEHFASAAGFPSTLPVRNTTGAGDAFLAGIAYGHYNKITGRSLLEHGLACASAAAASEKTVSVQISPELIKRIISGEIPSEL